MNTLFGAFTALALILLLVFIGPVITIWAINTLFGAGIELTFWNWIAVVWLHIVAKSTVSTSNKD